MFVSSFLYSLIHGYLKLERDTESPYCVHAKAFPQYDLIAIKRPGKSSHWWIEM